MPRQKRKRPVTTVKIDVLAHARLDGLQTALASQRLPGYVEHMEIISALVLYTSPEQLSGMVAAYYEATDRLLKEERGDDGDGHGGSDSKDH
jgi:hypothetical protein